MNMKHAVDARVSRRTYLKTEVSALSIEKLEAAVWECNRSGDLNIQVITEDEDPFNSIKKSYGLISGARNYIALIGKKDDVNLDEKLGYFGESLTLLATTLGLGTCWIGGSYDREECKCKIREDEKLKCVIIFGNVKDKKNLKEQLIDKGIHRNSKTIEDMLRGRDEQIPNWVIDGMRCVLKAPSARFKQPVTFYYSDGTVSAKVKGEGDYELVDLGIAKLHFEIGAGKGSWSFGNGGLFEYENSID